jgi:hypothetical protein
MSPQRRIYEMLSLANAEGRKFPATVLYNEGWLLRLVLDWFSGCRVSGHGLAFASGARWFSEALLPSQFLASRRADSLAEGYTHADGVFGHIKIGRGALADTTLATNACQFVVTEAKLFSPLSSGVTNARGYDQATRNVACMAHVVSQSGRQPREFLSLSFFVLAPPEQIEQKKLFVSLLLKASIQDKVRQRVMQYHGRPEEKAKEQWFQDWFEPTLEHIRIEALSWESIIDFIRTNDIEFGSELGGFYGECLAFNRLQEPELLRA